MKPKLLILSDLFGFDNSPWINNYQTLLQSDFQLVLYDSCKLAGIDRSHLTDMEVHSKFINGGINSAVDVLLKTEIEYVSILAFSIGGTIGWKAALSGLKVNSLFALSSTRLRYETKRPNCALKIIFGEREQFKPEDSWFTKLDLQPEIIKYEQHEFYKNEDLIKNLCEQIKHSR